MSTWNARGFRMPKWRKDGEADDGMSKDERTASKKKLAYLLKKLDTDRPDAAFVQEFNGDREAAIRLRKAVRKVGYEGLYLLGEGASGRDNNEEDSKTSWANGIFVALRRATTSAKEAKRVEERVFGLQVQINKGGGTELALANIHGLHHAGEASFKSQIDAAKEWLMWSTRKGGLLLGDFNFVACGMWRSGASAQPEDKILRTVAGNVCTCCAPAPHDGTSTWVTSRTMACAIQWTRRDKVSSSMIDGAVAFGSELVGWERAPIDWDEGLSDHAWVTFTKHLPPIVKREARPLPAWRRGDDAARDLYRDKAREAEVIGALEDNLASARKHGTTATAGAVAILRRCAMSCAKEAQRTQADQGHQRLARWRELTRAVIAARRQGADPLAMQGGTIFHWRTGLANIREHFRCAASEVIWQKIMRRCRRKLASARREMIERQNADDARMERKFEKMLKEEGKHDTMTESLMAWKEIANPRASVALSAFHPQDKLNNPEMRATNEGFLRGLGEEGKRMVSNFASTPPIKTAFRAWCALFTPTFSTIEALRGGPDGDQPVELNSMYSRRSSHVRCC